MDYTETVLLCELALGEAVIAAPPDSAFCLLSGLSAASVSANFVGRRLSTLLHPPPLIQVDRKLRRSVHWFLHEPRLPPVELTTTILPAQCSYPTEESAWKKSVIISCHISRCPSPFPDSLALQLKHVFIPPSSIHAERSSISVGEGFMSAEPITDAVPSALSGFDRTAPSAAFRTAKDTSCVLRSDHVASLDAQASTEPEQLCGKHAATVMQTPGSHDAYSPSLTVSESSSGLRSTSRSAFLANMSHELRTPLNGIVALVELLLNSSGMTPEQRELLQTVHESGLSLTRILSSIIDFSQLESGVVELSCKSINICDVVEECIECVWAESAKKGLLISSTFPRVAMTTDVLGDSLRIRQILVHLLSNAVKFTDSKGFVEVHCTMQPAESGMEATFQVVDHGIGIPEAFQQHLFTEFTQATESCTRAHGGLGLGLAIASHLAKRMGAILSISSQPGQGTTATLKISLPLADSTKQAAPIDLHTPNSSSTATRDPSSAAAPEEGCDQPPHLASGPVPLHALLAEPRVALLKQHTAVIFVEAEGLARQLRAAFEGLGMGVVSMNQMATPDVALAQHQEQARGRSVLVCAAEDAPAALRAGWKKRPIVALCPDGLVPHMLRVHVASLALPVKLRELVTAMLLALNGSVGKESLKVPLGRPKAVGSAARQLCTAGFGRSACGFCYRCQQGRDEEAAARQRISLDNSALEKIPRLLTTQQPSLCAVPECRDRDSYESSYSTDVHEGSSSKPEQQLKSRAMLHGMPERPFLSSSGPQEPHPLFIDEFVTNSGSSTSTNSLENHSLRNSGDHGRRAATIGQTGRHSADAPSALDAANEKQRQGSARHSHEQGSPQDVTSGNVAEARARVGPMMASGMRKSISLQDIPGPGSGSVAMQSFLYQPSVTPRKPEHRHDAGQNQAAPFRGGGELRSFQTIRKHEVMPETGLASTDSAQVHGALRSNIDPNHGAPRQEDVFPVSHPITEKRLRVLVAEDNKINQVVIKKVCQKVRANCHIDIVSDGEAALLTVLESTHDGVPYDLVLMDLHMPLMGGLEATRRIRERHPRTPLIVALTADTVVGMRQICLAAGMNEYVTKPFHVRDMQRVLQLCC